MRLFFCVDSRTQYLRTPNPFVVAKEKDAISLPHAMTVPDGRKDMALTVRIEINLPANASQEAYDSIFKSIRAHLINE